MNAIMMIDFALDAERNEGKTSLEADVLAFGEEHIGNLAVNARLHRHVHVALYGAETIDELPFSP